MAAVGEFDSLGSIVKKSVVVDCPDIAVLCFKIINGRVIRVKHGLKPVAAKQPRPIFHNIFIAARCTVVLHPAIVPIRLEWVVRYAVKL